AFTGSEKTTGTPEYSDGAFDLNGSNSVALLFLSTMVTDATTAGISIRIYAAFDGNVSGLTGFVE
ncbi:hypothetical protein, partial [Escherichia coli]|uniref:hypothetical protein n=2 Tax=Enterobacteriaceae TaxID=543 RepID=UPI001CCCDE08